MDPLISVPGLDKLQIEETWLSGYPPVIIHLSG